MKVTGPAHKVHLSADKNFVSGSMRIYALCSRRAITSGRTALTPHHIALSPKMERSLESRLSSHKLWNAIGQYRP